MSLSNRTGEELGTTMRAAGGLVGRNIRLHAVTLELYEGGSGPTLLFLHGFDGLRHDAVFFLELTRRYQVIAPLLPGYGASTLPQWMDAVHDFTYAQLELIRELDLRHVTLVGAAIGAWVAAELAILEPKRVSELVLVGPVGIKAGSVDRLDLPDVFAMAYADLDRAMFRDPSVWGMPSRTSDTDLLAYARHRETTALVTWEPYMHDPKLRHRLHLIRCPTTVVRGAYDGIVSADYADAFARLIPGATVTTIDDAAHVPHYEQPRSFLERVLHRPPAPQS